MDYTLNTTIDKFHNSVLRLGAPQPDVEELNFYDQFYNYTSLTDLPNNAIRLLDLHPGSFDDEVKCSIRSHCLSQKPEFSALSYMWGEAENEKHIILQNKVFPVRLNLWQCLLRLRHPQFSTRLWIDAVCVNQKDVPERNRQVGLMSSIYSTATRVIAWLGEDTVENIDCLAPFCTSVIGPNITSWASTSHPDPSSTFLDNVQLCRKKIGSSGEDAMEVLKTWRVLASIHQCRYWTRIWILQETILPSYFLLMAGPAKIPYLLYEVWRATMFSMRYDRLALFLEPSWSFNTDRDIAQALEECHWDADGGIPNVISALRADKFKKQVQRTKTLQELISLFHMQHCSDVRDKVFGLLSLSTDHAVLPQADYAKSASHLFLDLLEYLGGRVTSSTRLLRNALEVDEAGLLSAPNITHPLKVIMRPYASVNDPSGPGRKVSRGIQIARTSALKTLGQPASWNICYRTKTTGFSKRLERGLATVIKNTTLEAGDVLFKCRNAPFYLVYRLETTGLRYIGRACPNRDLRNPVQAEYLDRSKLQSDIDEVTIKVPPKVFCRMSSCSALFSGNILVEYIMSL